MSIVEELFKQLQNPIAIRDLIGTTEDLHLDCKVWPDSEKDAQKILAKAFCGFANADGGIVVVGMEAKAGPDKSDPDLIQHERPVADALAVKSRIENLVSQIVEPYLEGVRLEPVFEVPDEKRGFVFVAVPATEGFPCRSRKDWKDYQRISAGAMPMEYFQIADMFGKRRRPVLKLHLDAGDITRMGEISDRTFVVAIENCGRGIAKFPSNRFSRMPGIRCWRMWARW